VLVKIIIIVFIVFIPLVHLFIEPIPLLTVKKPPGPHREALRTTD